MKHFKTRWILFLVFVLPLYTNAHIMETHFHHQTDLGDVFEQHKRKTSTYVLENIVNNYQPMIPNSNLCWAACMESLIKGYGTQSKVGYHQLDIATYYYRSFGLDFFKTTWSSRNDDQKIDKIAMRDEHYQSMYQEAGFNIDFLSTDCLEDFKEATKEIDKENAFVLRVLENELSHILLVIGYDKGRYRIMDPDANTQEFYWWAPKDIVWKYGIEKLWKVSVHA